MWQTSRYWYNEQQKQRTTTQQEKQIRKKLTKSSSSRCLSGVLSTLPVVDYFLRTNNREMSNRWCWLCSGLLMRSTVVSLVFSLQVFLVSNSVLLLVGFVVLCVVECFPVETIYVIANTNTANARVGNELEVMVVVVIEMTQGCEHRSTPVYLLGHCRCCINR